MQRLSRKKCIFISMLVRRETARVHCWWMRNNLARVVTLVIHAAIVLKSVLADHFRRKTAEREALFLYAQEYQALSENIDIFADVEGDANVETDKVSCGCLSRLLPGLKAKYVDVITRVDIEQGDRKQVAKDIGITEKNLRVRLHRGALKKSCAHCDEGGCRTAEAAGIR